MTRVCIVQPVIPAYRTAFFNLLGASPDIDLEVWAGQQSPGAPQGDDPRKFVNFRFRQAPTRSCGPFLSQPALLRAIDDRFDVVVVSWNTRYLHLVPSLSRARRRHIATIAWGHGSSPRETALRRWVRDRVGRMADATLFYGETAANRLRRGSRGENRVMVAPNAIDQKPIRDAREWWTSQPGELDRFRIQHGLTDREIILFLSRLRAIKRVDLLISALDALRFRRPRCHLVIIGDGPERAALEAQVVRSRLSDRVTFVGALYDERAIAPWCLSAAVCALPGEVGLFILHAFGYGLPVVTCRGPHNPEIEALRESHNGLLYKPGDADDLAATLCSVLDDGARRQAMSHSALSTVSDDRYSLARMVEGFLDAIEAARAHAHRRAQHIAD